MLVLSSNRIGNRIERGMEVQILSIPQNRDGFCWRLTRNVSRMYTCRFVYQVRRPQGWG
nr:MAG TPA: hypothetical protein [Caudoviricetes sp.]